MPKEFKCKECGRVMKKEDLVEHLKWHKERVKALKDYMKKLR